MRSTRIMANLPVADIEAAKSFYTDYLGLSNEEFNMGWVARYTSPETGARVQLVTRDASAPVDSVISVHTADVEGAYREAQKLGLEIVVPLRTEPWGCTGSSSGHPTAMSSTSRPTQTESVVAQLG